MFGRETETVKSRQRYCNHFFSCMETTTKQLQQKLDETLSSTIYETYNYFFKKNVLHIYPQTNMKFEISSIFLYQFFFFILVDLSFNLLILKYQIGFYFYFFLKLTTIKFFFLRISLMFAFVNDLIMLFGDAF